ncbi:MAG: maleylpyruvate isomerase N-terminal domain-containing protein [Gemmatimonadales bacterium]
MADTSPALRPMVPVFVADRFSPLHAELIALLRGLQADDWDRPTVCPLWSVGDIAAHLLDDDLRRLSSHRDGQPPPHLPRDESPGALVELINRLNADWVGVARRMSPRVIVDLLEHTGPQVAELLGSLDPFGQAHFAVSWAGESQSENWFDVGRDYTERWLHQQQIRDAVGAPALLERRWFHPVLDLFVRALPHTYRNVHREEGTAVQLEVTGRSGGSWALLATPEGWRLYSGRPARSSATVSMTADTAWRLFSKALKTDADRSLVHVSGDHALGAVFFGSLGVIA